jgi:hypothetical protein
VLAAGSVRLFHWVLWLRLVRLSGQVRALVGRRQVLQAAHRAPNSSGRSSARWLPGLYGCSGETVDVMEKSVECMTLHRLRDELLRTRPAWDDLADLEDVLEEGALRAMIEDARRHQLVQKELQRRPSSG